MRLFIFRGLLEGLLAAHGSDGIGPLVDIVDVALAVVAAALSVG